MSNYYIFADFDGVLTSTQESPGSYLVEHGLYGISPTPVKNLMLLVEQTKAKVVISSNWRRFADDGVWHYKDRAFMNQLPVVRYMLGGSYAGTLPADRHITKSDALGRWFKSNSLKIDGYVVFDDDISEGFAESPFKDNFILTDYRTGLTAADVEKAKGILNNGRLLD